MPWALAWSSVRPTQATSAVEVDALQILANQRQTGLVAQVVGQLFDDEIGHGLFTCWVKQHMGSKPLISIENLRLFDCQVTDSGFIVSSQKSKAKDCKSFINRQLPHGCTPTGGLHRQAGGFPRNTRMKIANPYQAISMRGSRGFTLLEVVVTMAIAAILMGLALPSFAKLINKNRLSATTSDFVIALNTARVEAVRQGQRVTLCPSNNNTQCGGSWENGWIIFNDPNRNATVDTNTGESVFHAGAGASSGITIEDNLTSLNNTKHIFYTADSTAKVTGDAFPVTISIRSNGSHYAQDGLRCISINMSGRASVKTPSAQNCN